MKPDSRQLDYVLALLVTGRALVKVQGSGEGESAAVGRAMHEQWDLAHRARSLECFSPSWTTVSREHAGSNRSLRAMCSRIRRPEHARGT